MVKHYHQPTDKSYKFMYKILGIKLHRYFFNEGKTIEFIDTEIPESGKRRDITIKLDNNSIHNIEFQSNPLYDQKLLDMFEYHQALRCDKNYDDYEITTSVINITNPNKGKRNIYIKNNLTFSPDIIFTKEINGQEILNKLIYKTITQEELTDNDVINLLILPDTNIDLPINTLMKTICLLIAHGNILDDNFKKDIIKCEIMILRRFFTNNELTEMIDMLKNEMENPEIKRVIEKYGQGFDIIYFDGKEDGKIEGKIEGIKEGRIETAKKLIKAGIDEKIIEECTNINPQDLKNIKKIDQ